MIRESWGADLQRMDPRRFGDSLELRFTKIGHLKIEPRPRLPIGVFRKTDRAGLRYAFESDRDNYPDAHQVGVAPFDDVPDVDADPELDSPRGRNAGVALDHRALDFHCAPNGVDDAAELDRRSVAGPLSHAAAMHRDRGVDEVAAQRAEPRQDAVLVGRGESAESDDVDGHDRGKLSRFTYSSPNVHGSGDFVFASTFDQVGEARTRRSDPDVAAFAACPNQQPAAKPYSCWKACRRTTPPIA